MEYTKNYKLPQWVETDRIQMEHFNKAMADIDGGMTSAQGIGDRGMRNVRNLLYNLCHLTYQQDGGGTCTGWREGFDFDGLNADHRVVSTTGAAVVEPTKGQVRLAVDGWTGGSATWEKSYLSTVGKETYEILSSKWTPVGYANMSNVTFAVTLDTSSSTRYVTIYVVLMQGDTVVATSNTLSTYASTGSQTYTFSTAPALDAQKEYHLKMVLYNAIGNANYGMTLGNATITTTPVKMNSGNFETEAIALKGQEVIAWVQYSVPGAIAVDLWNDGVWRAMELEAERGNKTPDGTACTDGRFVLTLSEETESVQLRININSESECMVYGYGAVAL